jgi:hypothetical protein
MGRLSLWIAGFVFIAAGAIVVTSGGNWQSALILVAIGIGILFFLSRG